ncbi:MAG: hypothetical protein AB4038_08260 [Prochloraceae cyanobacterium]
MSETTVLDKIIKNVRVVRPNQQSVERLDLGIKDGKFAQIAPEISPFLETAKQKRNKIGLNIILSIS